MLFVPVLLPAQAEARHDDHGWGGGYIECKTVMQKVRLFGIITFREYGTACKERDGGWRLKSENPHPRRDGKYLYIKNHGRFIVIDNVRHPVNWGRKYYKHHFNPPGRSHGYEEHGYDHDDGHDYDRDYEHNCDEDDDSYDDGHHNYYRPWYGHR